MTVAEKRLAWSMVVVAILIGLLALWEDRFWPASLATAVVIALSAWLLAHRSAPHD
jgi:hypothetical protein